MNPFLVALSSGRARTAEDLKRLYRLLAKAVHPDSSPLPPEAAHERFTELRRQYEEARGLLAAPALPQAERKRKAPGPRPGTPRPPDRRATLQAFAELVSSNFPADGRVRASSKGYRAKLAAFDAELSAWGGDFVGLLPLVEGELYGIRGENIVINPLFGKVKLLMYNVAGYHYCPSAFALQAIRKWRAELDGDLDAAGAPRLKRLLDWLVDDLDRGPALS